MEVPRVYDKKIQNLDCCTWRCINAGIQKNKTKNMKNLNVLVVGAGIGGLQTALALAKDGHNVTIFESVKQFMEVSLPSRRTF